MKMVYCKVLLKTEDGLLQTIVHELRSMGPKLVPLLATRCLYLGTLRGHTGVIGWESVVIMGCNKDGHGQIHVLLSWSCLI